MYILDCDDPDVSANIKSDVNKYISKYKFELLMEIKDRGEVVRIYTSGNEMTVTGHEDYDSLKPYIAITDKTRKKMMETNFWWYEEEY